MFERDDTCVRLETPRIFLFDTVEVFQSTHYLAMLYEYGFLDVFRNPQGGSVDQE